MYHFFLTPDSIQGKQVFFPTEVAYQIMRVLRLGAGEKVAVLDNNGMLYTVVLRIDSAGALLVGEIISSQMIHTEPKIKISLFFGLTAREKVEWILQKATEIGVSAFSPFVSSRTLVTKTELSENKNKRWQQIIKEAAEQSGRGRLPVLNQPDSLSACLSHVRSEHELCLLAWEGTSEKELKLKSLKQHFSGGSIALFVGPEGGFSEDEVIAAKQAGCQVVSLGERILRVETAAIIFPALVLYELNNF